MEKNKIFTELVKPFFDNGVGIIEARPLTVDDFYIKEREGTKEYLMGGNHSSKDMWIEITLELKPQIILELEKMGYFSKFGKVKMFSELDDSDKRNQATRSEQIRKSLEEALKTESGGTIRKKEKVEKIVDKLIVDTRELADNGERDRLIQEMIESFNKNIQRIVKENNDNYDRDVLPPLTERERLDSIMEHNIEAEGVSKIKENHDVELGRIDGEIKVYQDKINELERSKTQVYRKTSQEFFKEGFEKLSPHIKEEIDKREAENSLYTKRSSRGIF
jgi:hypothetical protein